MKAKVLKMGLTPVRRCLLMKCRIFIFKFRRNVEEMFLFFFFKILYFFYMAAADMVGGVEPLTSIMVLLRERCDSTSFL